VLLHALDVPWSLVDRIVYKNGSMKRWDLAHDDTVVWKKK
jgi:hypothetical protein